jgi:hypothetical protein
MEGYISQYKKSASHNTFDEDIFSKLYQNILENCFGLIENGYRGYLADTEKVFSADETQITAGIYDHIETIINTEKLPFDVVPEYPIYSKEIRKGKKSPKKAKRFDLLILTWNKDNEKFRFGVEAKLLAETNYKTKVASTLIKEYVEDAGMGKFIKNLYDPNSYNKRLMLGHILNGTTESIVKKINERIITTYSIQEQLDEYGKHYISSYAIEKKRRNLYHIFLNFSTLVN